MSNILESYEDYVAIIEDIGEDVALTEEEFTALSEEELSEISKNLAGRYMKANVGNPGTIGGKGGLARSALGAGSSGSDMHDKRMAKRQKGMHQAIDKLTGKAKVSATEEVENVVDTTVSEESLAASSLHPAAKSVADPKSKIGMMQAVIGVMGGMPKTELTKWFDQAMAVYGPGKDHGVGDKSAANQSSVDMAAGAGPKTREAMPKLSVKEDVEEMFVGADLTEEFKEKASTLFEAAVAARASLEIARLEEEYEDRFSSAVDSITEELTNQIDSYLDYVAEDWLKENEVAVESTLRNELMEEFMEGLKGLFAEHYIDVPQSKVDVIESLAVKVEELEAHLNEAINENFSLKGRIVESEREEVIHGFAEDLTMSQQEKFAALAEGIDFNGDLETYARKLSIVKETYFSPSKKPTASTNIEEETFEGDVGTNVIGVDPSVNRYVQAISKTIKK